MLVSSLLPALLLPYHSWGKSLPRQSTQSYESRSGPPPGYILTGPASPDTILTLRLALKQGDYKGLIEALLNVSTPSHEQYGAHLSKEEVSHFVLCETEADLCLDVA